MPQSTKNALSKASVKLTKKCTSHTAESLLAPFLFALFLMHVVLTATPIIMTVKSMLFSKDSLPGLSVRANAKSGLVVCF